MYKPTGIIHITGEPDVGKTLLALTAYHPKQTAYFFDDVKRPPVDSSQFGLFIDLISKYGNLKMLEFYKAIWDEIDQLPQVDSLIFDTWSRIGKAIRYYAKANPFNFREQSTFAQSGTIANMEKWSEAHNVEAMFISRLSEKCKALFLITHIKEKLIAGARTGVNEPDCGKSFDRVCNLRLWLRHNEHSAVPIALVLKRISKIEVTKTGIEPLNVLPRRIVPSIDDRSIWQTIDRYWDNPVGNREPLEAEKPTDYELSILDGVLTNDQKQVWQAELREKQRQEKEEAEFFNSRYQEMQSKALELANGKSGPPPMIASQILEAMKVDFPEVTIEEVAGMLKGA